MKKRLFFDNIPLAEDNLYTEKVDGDQADIVYVVMATACWHLINDSLELDFIKSDSTAIGKYYFHLMFDC